MIPEVYWSSSWQHPDARPTFDAIDAEILKSRAKAFINQEGPCVGDWCIFPDGEYRRFTHDWGNQIQTTCAKMYGSFYLCSDGGVSYSGSLDPGLPKDSFELTDEFKAAPFWFFHHDNASAHNGVNVTVLARVYRVKP